MQANVREKLFTMLGDRSRAAAAASSSSRDFKRDSQSASSEVIGIACKDAVGISQAISQFEEDDLCFQSDENLYDSSDELDEWSCSICTLINPPGTQICSTCESIKQ